MNIAFYLAHPSQYYVFKQSILKLKINGHKIHVFIKAKDILEDILIKDQIHYLNVTPNKKKYGFLSLLISVFKKNISLFKEFKKKQIDLLLTAASDSCQVSYLMGIPSIDLNDDDASVVKKSALFGWPFATNIFAPESCNMGYWSKKTFFYKAYQKLFYLHPNYFNPDLEIVKKYVSNEKPYIIIRSVSLTAHHDKNIRGLSNELVEKLIKKLSSYANIYIFSERRLPESLEKYKLKINPLHMHHLLYYAKMIIGDSQSMAHEAAVMGTPSIRYNDFVGRIGVLEELEHKYGLTFGITPDQPEKLVGKAEELVNLNENETFRNKAKSMIDEMIDPTAFLVWFIKNYPESRGIIKDNPPYQYRFK
jgi:predicted glycosyltransferase